MNHVIEKHLEDKRTGTWMPDTCERNKQTDNIDGDPEN
jgi:hypothetical protein